MNKLLALVAEDYLREISEYLASDATMPTPKQSAALGAVHNALQKERKLATQHSWNEKPEMLYADPDWSHIA